MQAPILLPRCHHDGHLKAKSHQDQCGRAGIPSPCWQSMLLCPGYHFLLMFTGSWLQGCVSIMALHVPGARAGPCQLGRQQAGKAVTFPPVHRMLNIAAASTTRRIF